MSAADTGGGERAMTAAEVLSAAADLLEKPGAWGQFGGTLQCAATADGRWCLPWSPDAACWCAWGALDRTDRERSHEAARILEQVADADWIADWNDAPGRTQAEVVAALRAAATQVQAGGEG